MATKVECDGCGADITRSSFEVVEVKWSGASDRQTGKFDLCRSCAGHMDREANPTRWPRGSAEPE